MGNLILLDKVYVIDWKDGLKEIQAAILALSGLDPFVDLLDAMDCDAITLLSHASKRLASQGLCLVNFDDGSDTYQISVTKCDFDVFYRICKKLKFKVQQISCPLDAM
jgi:hypothetical protein